MDSRSATVEPNQTYQPVNHWGRISVPSTPRTPAASTSGSSSFTDATSAASPYPPAYDLLPLLVSQHQAQLLQYNKLISPGRGGGGLQSPPLTSALPVPNIQAAPRSRSSSKVSNKESHSVKQSPAPQSCHGTRGPKSTDRSEREGMTKGKDTDKETPRKMPPKQQPDLAHPLPSRPPPRANPAQQSTSSSTQSISVPSTPHQRPRNFFEESESREPSPTVAQNHSPRSAYSEPNGGAASMPPRPFTKPCQYETASRHFRRRIPYSIGSDRLERVGLDKVKDSLSKDEERKLSTDMRELYDRLLPSAKVEENRKKLVQKLEQIFNDEWPGHEIQVHLFGSSGNLLCSDDSDGWSQYPSDTIWTSLTGNS